MSNVRHTALMILLLVVVSIAGCNGGEQFPDGANASGFSPELADTYTAQFDQIESFTYTASSVQAVNGEIRNVEYELRANLNKGRFLAIQTGPEEQRITFYEDKTAYVRTVNASGNSTSVIRNARSPATQVKRLNRTIRSLARRGNFTYTGQVSTANGRGYRYTADDVDPTVTGTIPASNVSAELIVLSNGLVLEIELAFDLETQNASRRVRTTGRFNSVNQTTVDTPQWVRNSGQRVDSTWVGVIKK